MIVVVIASEKAVNENLQMRFESHSDDIQFRGRRNMRCVTRCIIDVEASTSSVSATDVT